MTMAQEYYPMDGNSPLCELLRPRIELKAKARDMQINENTVPPHMTLPDLKDILQMRTRPTTPNDREEDGTGEENTSITTFMFVVDYLVGAVLGKKAWNDNKFRDLLSKKFTPSDEAFLYVILMNSYDLWINAEGSRVGNGNLTKDGTNKKFCGWTREGIQLYNDLLQKVKLNRAAAWASVVEDAVMKALRSKYKYEARRHSAGVRRRRKRGRHYDDEDSDGERSLVGDVDAHNDLGEAFLVTPV